MSTQCSGRLFSFSAPVPPRDDGSLRRRNDHFGCRRVALREIAAKTQLLAELVWCFKLFLVSN